MKTFFLNILKKLSTIAFSAIFLLVLQPYFENIVNYDKNSDEGIDIQLTSDLHIKSDYGHLISDFPHYEQGKKYPTGCEAISTLMVLNYYGYNVNADLLIKDYLPCAEMYEDTDENGEIVLFAADPNEYFIGDPYDDESFGCYSPVIANMLRDYCGDSATIINRKGTKFDKLLNEYVKNDIPVILWATMDMKESWHSISWKIAGTNKEFDWISGEHCLVLIGYDKENCYFSDPSRKETVTVYQKSVVEKRYDELGKQSVILIKK